MINPPNKLDKHIHKKEEDKNNGVTSLVDILQGLNYLLENENKTSPGSALKPDIKGWKGKGGLLLQII